MHDVAYLAVRSFVRHCIRCCRLMQVLKGHSSQLHGRTEPLSVCEMVNSVVDTLPKKYAITTQNARHKEVQSIPVPWILHRLGALPNKRLTPLACSMPICLCLRQYVDRPLFGICSGWMSTFSQLVICYRSFNRNVLPLFTLHGYQYTHVGRTWAAADEIAHSHPFFEDETRFSQEV